MQFSIMIVDFFSLSLQVSSVSNPEFKIGKLLFVRILKNPVKKY